MTKTWSERSWMHRGFKNGFSGFVAGAAICCVGHPFDTLKIRLQMQPTVNPVYNGLADCFVKTMKWEGIAGFYKGVASPLVGSAVLRSVVYGTYLQFVSYSNSHTVNTIARLSYMQYAWCGAATGVVCSFVEGPIDLFKTKLQIQILRSKSGLTPEYTNVFHCGHHIATKYGMVGVYQGLGATFIRNIPSNAIFFANYELGRQFFMYPGHDVTQLTIPEQMASGVFAGLTYWLFTYPTDVVKSAMQSDRSEKSLRKHSNSLQVIRHLYHHEGGWIRFFKGYIPCLMRCLPSSISLLVLERCRLLFP